MAKIKAWADEAAVSIRPKSLTAVATRYMLERWTKLTLFLEEPLVDLDTNPVENAIRPFVMRRKAWLFADTINGGEASAALYSLVSTAKANSLDPRHCFSSSV